MLYFMPALFTVMMLFLPSGLGIYMLTNSVLGIVQQQAVERFAPRPGPDIEVRDRETPTSAEAKATRARRTGKPKLSGTRACQIERRIVMPTPEENNELDASWLRGTEADVTRQRPTTSRTRMPTDHPTVDGPRPSYDEARADSARDFVEDCGQDGHGRMVDLLEPEPGDPPGEIRIEIEGRDSGRIIGKKGQVLSGDSAHRQPRGEPARLDRRHVVVDAEGYRQRREDTLATMAQRLGQKALEEGKIITFEPMSPRDRRIVHLALAKFPGVVTKSDGEGEGRRVQIIPVRR